MPVTSVKKPKATKKTVVTPVETKVTHVAFILDRSTSMLSCKSATIEGFNSQLETILENAQDGGDTRVSLWTFSNDVREVFLADSLERIKPLDNENYRPSGGTAMYDAVGDATIALEKLDNNDANVAFLVIVISDGEENSSTRFNSAMIANQVERLEAKGNWTFVYLGANQDLKVVSETLNISAQNMMTFTSDEAGTQVMYAAAKNNTDGYFKSVRGGNLRATKEYTNL